MVVGRRDAKALTDRSQRFFLARRIARRVALSRTRLVGETICKLFAKLEHDRAKDRRTKGRNRRHFDHTCALGARRPEEAATRRPTSGNPSAVERWTRSSPNQRPLVIGRACRRGRPARGRPRDALAGPYRDREP